MVQRAEDEEGDGGEGGGEKGGGGRRIVRRKVTSAANPAHRLQDTGAERCTQGDSGSKSQTSVPPVLFTCRGMHGCACLGVVMIDGLKKKKKKRARFTKVL